MLPFVFHLGIFASSTPLFSGRDNLLLMDMNFVNHNPCMLSWPGVFLFSIVSIVALCKSRCMSTSGPSLFFHLIYLLGFLLSSFVFCCRNALFETGCSFVFMLFQPTCKLNFLSLFERSYFACFLRDGNIPFFSVMIYYYYYYCYHSDFSEGHQLLMV